MEVPGQTGAPEDAPVVLGSEYGRGAAFDGGVRHVAVVVTITGGSQGAEVAVQAVASRRNPVLGVLARKGDALHVAVGEAFRVVDNLFVVGLGNAPVHRGKEVVLARKVMVELCRYIAGIGGVVAVGLLVATPAEDFVGVVEVRVLSRLELVRAGPLGIDAETGHHAQVFEELVLGVEVVGNGQVLAGVGGTDGRVVHRVGHQAEVGRNAFVGIVLALQHFFEFAFLVIRRQVRIEGGIVAETAPGRFGTVHGGNAHDVPEGPPAPAVG